MELRTSVIATTATHITWAWMFAIFWLNELAIWMLTLLIIVDTLTWFTKAWINKEAKSSQAIRGIISKFYLLLIPICISAVWLVAGLNLSWLISATLWMLAFAELYSIIANIHEIRTRKKLPEYDAVSAVISGLLKVIRKILDSNNLK